MHDGMPYGWNQGQGQGHSREVDRQSPTGLIFLSLIFNDTATTEIYTLSLHDALPISAIYNGSWQMTTKS